MNLTVTQIKKKEIFLFFLNGDTLQERGLKPTFSGKIGIEGVFKINNMGAGQERNSPAQVAYDGGRSNHRIIKVYLFNCLPAISSPLLHLK